MSEPRRVRISTDVVAAHATLNDTSAAGKIWDWLPMEFRVSTWGDELYGSIPMDLDMENPQDVVMAGDLAFWPPGHAFCIFFGPTPASRGDEVRAASDVIVFGHIEGDPTVFRAVQSGSRVKVEQA